MLTYIAGLGECQIEEMFTCGAYKYGYVVKACQRYLVRYDYAQSSWDIACKA